MPCAATPVPALVDELARGLDHETARSGWGQPPKLVPVGSGGEPVGPPPDLSDAADPVGALFGLVAPGGWQAVGFVAEGTAQGLSGSGPQPVRLVVAVDRAGRTASRVRDQSGPVALSERDGDGLEGRLVDACRRMFGLRTAPPDGGSDALWAALWLDDVLAGLAGTDRARDWPTVASRHPGARAVVDADPALADLVPAELVAVGRAMARARPWAELRTANAEGRWRADGISAEVAKWMDDGMFARAALAPFPPLADLLEAVGELVPAVVARRVAAALGDWELIGAASGAVESRR